MNSEAIMTADDLLHMPHNGDRYELVRGELRTMSLGGSRHGSVGSRLGACLGHHVLTHDLGEVFNSDTGFRLASDPDTVRATDVSFVAKERLPAKDLPDTFWEGAPDLSKAVGKKVDEYLHAGAGWFWLSNLRNAW